MHHQHLYVGGGLQPGAALVVFCLTVVTLPPRSTVQLWLVVVVWLDVVWSADCLYAVTLCLGCLSVSLSAWGPFWPPVTNPVCNRSLLVGLGWVPIAWWSLVRRTG